MIRGLSATHTTWHSMVSLLHVRDGCVCLHQEVILATCVAIASLFLCFSPAVKMGWGLF